MQWYEATSKKLEVGHRYSHQDLIRLLKSDYPQMRERAGKAGVSSGLF